MEDIKQEILRSLQVQSTFKSCTNELETLVKESNQLWFNLRGCLIENIA